MVNTSTAQQITAGKKMEQNNKLNQTTLTSWYSPYDLACTALAVILGLVVGWLDVHTTEVVVTIMALLTVGLLLGLLQPRAAWRWAVLIAVGLPIMAAVAHLTGMQTAEPARLDVRIAIVALAVALVGCYIGVLARRTTRGLGGRST